VISVVMTNDNDSIRRASHATASSWRALSRDVVEIAPDFNASGEDGGGKTLCERLQATREETLLMEEHPELKRQKKLAETNDATKVWALRAGQSTVNATAAPFLKWCEEHFRYIDRRDVEALTPRAEHLMENDGDYLIGGLGRHYIHGWDEEDKEESKKSMERKRLAVLNREQAPATKKRAPSNNPKPKVVDKKYEITRVSPLEKPEEIDEYCGVCFDGDSYDDNQILFCDKCDIAVHQVCYGIHKIPNGDWNCTACRSRAKRTCCLCSVRGGALKPTTDGRWAHLFCAQWIPELFIANIEAMEPIDVGHLLQDRQGLTCSICKETGVGACIQCAYGACSVPFHPMCALKAGVRMEVRSTANSTDCDYMCYCEKHVKEMEKKARRCANGQTSTATTPAQTPMKAEVKAEEEEPAKETAPSPAKPTTPKEEVKPTSPQKDEPMSTPRAEVIADHPMRELGANEIRKLISNLFDISTLTASDIDGVDKADFVTWLRDDDDALRNKENSTTTPSKILPSMNPNEIAAREWLARRAKVELLAPIRLDGSTDQKVSDSAMEDVSISPSVAKVESKDEETYLYPANVCHPIEQLAEYTRLTLETVRVPAIPKTLEEVNPEQSGPNGIPQSMRPPKCQVCVIRKQGVCGTASAPPRCLRRRENMEKIRQAERAEMEAKLAPGERLPDPIEKVKAELARIEKQTDFLRLAPDDEVVAEIYRAQTALARTSLINRHFIQRLLSEVKQALPEEGKLQEEQELALRDTSTYEERWRGGRWRMERLKAEGKEEEAQFDGGELAGADMCDPLVESGAMEDALCCVCAGGESEYPNEIVFCERCEMCVHQQCYGVTNIPEGEWLCWPCHETERLERANGLPGTRPPRYMREAGDGAMYDPRVQCMLCPVKRGALRTIVNPATQTPMTGERATSSPQVRSQTAAKTAPDGRAEVEADPPTPSTPKTPAPQTPNRGRNRWCHVVCAHWQQGMETDLYLDGPSAITGLEEIRTQFRNARCSACRLDDGACIPCCANGCPVVFHPLCARRCGWHMLPYQSPEPLAFCARHSVQERNNPGSTMRSKYSANASGARFGQRVSSKRKRTPTIEEMEMLRRARVGLETLRLLCDRVIKREKLKRLELEQHHKLWLAQIRSDASGPVYNLGDDTQAHVKIPDVAKDRKLIFLTAEEAKRYEEDLVTLLPPDIRLIQAAPIDPPFREEETDA
jgi:bromodomain and PHD finger-containing protein 1